MVQVCIGKGGMGWYRKAKGREQTGMEGLRWIGIGKGWYKEGKIKNGLSLYRRGKGKEGMGLCCRLMFICMMADRMGYV